MRKISFEIPDRDERGVSPVIGVILMVAITVILAAVIASFVLGFGDSVQENVQAGADIQEKDDGTVQVTWISEGNADHVNVSVSPTTDVAFQNPDATIGDVELQEVGNTATIIDSTDGDGDHTVTVIVTAVGSSGTRTVVSQKEVTVQD